MAKCKICEKEFDGDRQLHAHLKAHDLSMVEYYQTYYPKHDLHTGDIIKFKNKKQSEQRLNQQNLKKTRMGKPQSRINPTSYF